MYIYIYTRKTPVSPSPKLSFVPFEFCSSCRRTAVFAIFKFKKMHFDLRPPMNLSTSILRGRRSVLWPCKTIVLHFRWQARDFLRFWHVLDGLFFLSCLWRCFLSLGGWRWGHDNVLSFPSSLRFMLTRQWCYALGFLGFMLTRQWCYALDFLRCDVNTSSDVTLLTFFVVMLTRHWCDALDFLRCYVNTSVMWRSWLSSLLC